MPVYVDDMRAPYGRMVMCHMVADADEELHAMADKIGVARRWHQKGGTPHSHYDICQAKRAAAVRAGAVEIDRARLGEIIRAKRAAGRGPTQAAAQAAPVSGQEGLVHGGCVALGAAPVPETRNIGNVRSDPK